MAVLTAEKVMERIRARIGDDVSDEAISLVEDVSDTLTSLEEKATATPDLEAMKTEYEKKIADTENAWRQKYRDRFFSEGAPQSNVETDSVDVLSGNDVEDEVTIKSYDELFTVE